MGVTLGGRGHPLGVVERLMQLLTSLTPPSISREALRSRALTIGTRAARAF